MCASFALSVLLALPGALGLRFLRGGEPVSGLKVTLEGSAIALEGKTRDDGVVRFLGVPEGAYVLKADSLEWNLVLTSETELLTLDLDGQAIQAIHAGRFGRTTLTGESLSRLPHAGTISTVLETLEPFAVTDRIDVAGVESATGPLWSVRGSSWTQNRILVDGLDVTDPAGGASLLYPDVAFFDEISLVTSAAPPDVSGPGAELHLVSRAPPSSFESSLSLRYTGSTLQSENLSDELEGLGVEPRQVLRFPSARLEMGGGGFYGAIQGFDLGARLPKFDAEEKARLLGAAGKLTGERWSLLGIAQRIDRPTYGARPLAEAATAVEATETFRVAQASLDAGGFFFRLGFARGELDSTYSGYSGEGSPLRDLATGELFEAPLLVTDRTRARWNVVGAGDFLLSGHLLRGGVELSRASETGRERVPGSTERLMVDGVGHALSSYSGSGEREASATRLALHLKDAFFFDAFRVSPGVRLDLSYSGPIRWGSLSGTVDLGYALTPSSEIQFSLGRYPHVLTTRLRGVEQGLSWMWRRWNDANGDRRPSENEVGEALRRGGGGYTSIEEDLPRPFTHELTVGIEKHFRRGFLRFSGYQRWEKRLLQTVNVGIAPESYETFLFHDVGVDGDLGTEDDREIPIYDQRRQRGEDLFRLTQPPGLESFAQGVDLLLGFDHGRVSWQLSGRAYRDVGSGNVGNEPEENDTGIPGDLFDDPNTLTSAEGRLYFDRAFTGKLALTARAPLGIDVGAAIRYWDGQPFARQIFFEDLGQGFTVVQAYFRGRLRYAFNMTVDVRLEREFPFGRSRLALGLDAFNLFNQTLQTGENVRSGETFREPTFVQPARTITLSGRLRF